jgi:glycosyltransferase involved in cell wall biosynthesis
MNKEKCLLILPRNIFPVVGGYSNHRKNAIEILHRHYCMSIVVISHKQLSEEERVFLEQNSNYFRYITIPHWRHIVGALAAIFSSLPVQVGYFYFGRVQRIVDGLLPHQDIVIGSLIRTMRYLEHTPSDCKIVFDMIDSIGLNYQRSAKRVHSFFWSLMYRLEANRLLHYEAYWIKRSYATMFFNKDECDYWRAYGNVCLLPHGVNDRALYYDAIDARYSRSVAFVGKMDYQPNIDAVRWYVNNVHSFIGDRIPLIIVGAYPTNEIVSLAKKNANITVTGFIEDPFVIIHSAMVVVAPMQTGAGIQNKVLEAMALGAINILTSMAAAPIIGGINGEHFLIADIPDEFHNIILDISEQPDAYKQIKQSARNFIAENYTWTRYEKEYIKAINTPPPPIHINKYIICDVVLSGKEAA